LESPYEDIILFGAREEKAGASSLNYHSLAEDVKLNARGRHPIAYPFYFLFVFHFHFIFLFSFVFHCYFSVLFFRDKYA
jgi:hypothetical protein